MKINSTQNPWEEPTEENPTRARQPARQAGESLLHACRRLEAKALGRITAIQSHWETMEHNASEPFYHLKCQALVWLVHMGKRWRESNVPPRDYRIALYSLLVATLLSFALRNVLPEGASLFFLGAVIVSAGIGGLRAGLLTTLLALLPCAVFLHPALNSGTGIISAIASLTLFAGIALVTCVLSDSLCSARQQAEIGCMQAEAMAQRFRFLAEASAMLDDSHNFESMLTQVTRAIVPAFADWAAVEMLEENQVHLVAVTHLDPAKEPLLRLLRQRFSQALDEEHPLGKALVSGQGQLVVETTEDILTSWMDAIDDRELVHTLVPRSIICVPLIARDRVLGALTFASTSLRRRYNPTDLVVARDLASRVALAVDNLRLYQKAQQEIIERTHMEQQIRGYSQHLERQRQELEEANALLALQANTDGLTGLNNHRVFQETLAREFERAQRYHAPLSLLMLDVDHFKQYNDTYGHPAGDQVLKSLATVLETNARRTDFVARYGGEEFVIILPETDEQGVLETAERIRQAVEATVRLERPVTASFGAATFNPQVQSASDLIALADRALYNAKQQGRNCVSHADTLPPETEAAEYPALAPRQLEEKLQTHAVLASRIDETVPLLAPLPSLLDELAEAYEASIEGWGSFLHMRDRETQEHAQRITEITLHLARSLGIGEEELVYIRWGVLLHDVGKMAIPDSILHKPGPLDEAEWEIMRRHPTYAYEMLSRVAFLRHALDIPYNHHERWDGSGYPRGIAGAQIPLAARIFAVVDVWDALRSDRPYRRGWSNEQALAYIQSHAGLHFDPQVVESFLALVGQQEAIVNDVCMAKTA